MPPPSTPAAPPRGLHRAGIWLGIALAGFFDGIVLHQVLQWHHMVSTHYPPTTLANLEINTLADGLFHLAAYLFAALGLVELWRARAAFGAARWARGFLGSLLMGAGSFNLVEGLVDHQLIGLHHVRQGSPHELAWDLGFLALSALILAAGWWLWRDARLTVPPTPP